MNLGGPSPTLCQISAPYLEALQNSLILVVGPTRAAVAPYARWHLVTFVGGLTFLSNDY